jgi:hypothetical protein
MSDFVIQYETVCLLLSQGKLGEALGTLTNVARAAGFRELADEAVVHSGRYSQMRSGVRFGVVDPEDARREHARLSAAAIELAQELWSQVSPDSWSRVNAGLAAKADAPEGIDRTAGHLKQAERSALSQVFHGNVRLHMGNNNSISNSNVAGAVIDSTNSSASGNADGTIGQVDITQEQHRQALQEMQLALTRSQDALDGLGVGMYDALGQFLRIARGIRVDQQSLSKIQVQMKEALDEVWAEHLAKGMKPKLLPKGLELAEVLWKSPLMREVAKRLIGA